MNRTKRYNYPATSLLLALLMAAGCSSSQEPEGESAEGAGEGQTEERSDRITLSPESLESLRLAYSRVEEQELSPSIEVPAEIMAVPDRRATVGPRVAGRVVGVRFNIGDRVERGTPLVTLESEDVGRAWADLIAARARENVARRALTRKRRLLADRVVSERAVEEAAGALQVAEADLQAAGTRLATFGIAASEDVPDNPARVTLRSPLAGTVVSRSAHLGQWIEPSETVAEVVELTELWLQAAVYERDMRLVRLGQPVQAEVRAFPGEAFTGTVAQVAGSLDERTRTVVVRVVLPNPGRRLRPGMFATARIQGTTAQEPRRLLAVPWSAVQEVDDRRAVFVKVADNVFELRRVRTCERAGDWVEVLNGLSSGEEVVAEGSFLLKGQLLRATLAEEE